MRPWIVAAVSFVCLNLPLSALADPKDVTFGCKVRYTLGSQTGKGMDDIVLPNGNKLGVFTGGALFTTVVIFEKGAKLNEMGATYGVLEGRNEKTSIRVAPLVTADGKYGISHATLATLIPGEFDRFERPIVDGAAQIGDAVIFADQTKREFTLSSAAKGLYTGPVITTGPHGEEIIVTDVNGKQYQATNVPIMDAVLHCSFK